MIQFKLTAALVVALSAIVLGAETDEIYSEGLWRISVPLQKFMSRMSSDDQANPEKAFSLADNYIKGKGFNSRVANELSSAWKRVVYQPDQCDGSSLRYIATIAQIAPQNVTPMRTLADATQKYARKCLTPGLIKLAIDADLEKASAKLDIETSEFKFIDDVVSDYLSKRPQDRKFMNMTRGNSRLLTESWLCDHRENTEDMNMKENCRPYLERRLYTPCSKLQGALREVVGQISSASNFLDEGYDNLIASLDMETQKVFLRFQFCHVTPAWTLLNDNNSKSRYSRW